LRPFGCDPVHDLGRLSGFKFAWLWRGRREDQVGGGGVRHFRVGVEGGPVPAGSGVSGFDLVGIVGLVT